MHDAGRQERIAALAGALTHPDRSQLYFQVAEIAGEQTYLQHGVRVQAGDVVLDVLRGIDDADWPRIRQVALEVHDHHERVAAVLAARGFAVACAQERAMRDTPIRMMYGTRT